MFLNKRQNNFWTQNFDFLADLFKCLLTVVEIDIVNFFFKLSVLMLLEKC